MQQKIQQIESIAQSINEDSYKAVILRIRQLKNLQTYEQVAILDIIQNELTKLPQSERSNRLAQQIKQFLAQPIARAYKLASQKLRERKSYVANEILEKRKKVAIGLVDMEAQAKMLSILKGEVGLLQKNSQQIEELRLKKMTMTATRQRASEMSQQCNQMTLDLQKLQKALENERLKGIQMEEENARHREQQVITRAHIDGVSGQLEKISTETGQEIVNIERQGQLEIAKVSKEFEQLKNSMAVFVELKGELQVWQQRAAEKSLDVSKLKEQYKEEDRKAEAMVEEMEDLMYQTDQNTATLESTKTQINVLRDMTTNMAVDTSRVNEAAEMYQRVVNQLKQEKDRIMEEYKYLISRKQ